MYGHAHRWRKKGREHGYSIFLVREAFLAMESTWHEGIDNMFKEGMEAGDSSIQVRGKKTKFPNYCSIQAVFSPCKCKYDYAGTARHPVVQLPNDDFGVMDDVLHLLRIKCDFLSEGDPFNEVVINTYDLAGVENAGCVPWHTDDNELLSDKTVILSVSTHAPGVFCDAERIPPRTYL